MVEMKRIELSFIPVFDIESEPKYAICIGYSPYSEAQDTEMLLYGGRQ